MQGGLKRSQQEIQPLYDQADEFQRQADRKQAEIDRINLDPHAPYPEQQKAPLQAQRDQFEASRKQAEKAAGLQVAGALPQLRAANQFPDFPYRKTFEASSITEFSDRTQRFIYDKLSILNIANEKLHEQPKWIYKLDILLDYAKKHLPVPIEKGSIYDQIIKDQAEAITKHESIMDDLLTLLSIALMFVPGGMLVALPINLTLLARSIEKFNEEQLGFKSGLSSTEPSSFPVLLNALGVIGDVTQIFGLAGKGLGTGEHLVDTASASAKDIEATGAASKGEVASEQTAAELKTAVTHNPELAAIGDAEIAEEIAYVDRHPERIKRDPLPHATVEGHEIVQLPTGGCERHSIHIPVPCPRSFRTAHADGDSVIFQEPSQPQVETRRRLQTPGNETEINALENQVVRPPEREAPSQHPFDEELQEHHQDQTGVIEDPIGTLTGPGRPRISGSSLASLEHARQAGIPGELVGDAHVYTAVDFPEIVPDAPPAVVLPAPPARPLFIVDEAGLPVGFRPVSRSEIQNLDMLHDYDLLISAGADPDLIRINQMQVIDDMRVGTNRPDLYAELNGRRIHIEYDRAPGDRSIGHAQRILTNDPEAIVILKIVDF